MNKKNQILSVLIATTLSFIANAQQSKEFTNAKCEEVLIGSGDIQINRQWDVANRVCFISVTPRNITNLKYRDYYFDNTGHFMVFNSYGEGPNSTTTAARDFYLFPIINDYPDYSINANGDVEIKMVSGHILKISQANFSILSFTPGSFTEKPVSPNNNGGLEIRPKSGFWFDAGFMMGNTPLSKPKNKTKIQSAKSSQICLVQNSEYLNYLPYDEIEFKFTGLALDTFVKQKCPQLKL